ncbi:MAG TPA: hypothetical protein VEQ60_02910, partial [Longimicrobium sp.]|nr:hypothetical protein [Longimicrobium sp.]
MVLRAPALTPARFNSLKGASDAQVKARFEPWILKLHDFLNSLPCVASVQRIRNRQSEGATTFQAQNI